jgi:hypothetical protein
MKALNGNYVQYSNGDTNYAKQNNKLGTPPYTYDNNILCPETNEKDSKLQYQTDGKEIPAGPYYQTGVIPCQKCPFYNYTLPYNYPYVDIGGTPNPKYYWYYPYYYDPNFYNNPYSFSVPKVSD